MKVSKGDLVSYRPDFGKGEPESATIINIEVCPEGMNFGGERVESADTEEDNCVIDLSNGKWCHGYQIERVIG